MDREPPPHRHGLADPEQLAPRLELLDQLDRTSMDPAADQLRAQIEAANAAVYDSIRAHIRGGSATKLRNCIAELSTAQPAAGLGYDHLDDLFAGVLNLREPARVAAKSNPDVVFYQPTPGRHIVRLLQLAELLPQDTLIDLGSGLGHVPILAAILTPARTMGVELEPAYDEIARGCAADLNLSRVAFVLADATTVDLSAGTVFYLYTPARGDMLQSLLERLHAEAETRTIRVYSLGPCTVELARQKWLRSTTPADPGQISAFVSLPV